MKRGHTGTTSSRTPLPFNTYQAGPTAAEVLEARRANAARYNNYIRVSASPAKDKSAAKTKKASTAHQTITSHVQTNRQQSISKLSEIKVGAAIPTKKTKKKKEEDLASSELYSFPSISQIRKMTPLKASATPLEKDRREAADRSFSMSTGSEVFGSVAHTDNINKQREAEPEPTSPTFVPDSEPDEIKDKESVGFKSKSNRSYIEEITREQQRKKEEAARADERKTQLK